MLDIIILYHLIAYDLLCIVFTVAFYLDDTTIEIVRFKHLPMLFWAALVGMFLTPFLAPFFGCMFFMEICEPWLERQAIWWKAFGEKPIFKLK